MTVDAYRVLDILTGYQGAAVIAAGHRLGVFDAMTDTPREVADIAADLRAAPRPLAALLAALSELGVIGRVGDGFVATDMTARLGAQGDLGLVVRKEAFFAGAWTALDTVVRDGAPLLDAWEERLRDDPTTAHDFLAALVTLARETGPNLLGLPELATPARVVDLGGGLGSYAQPLAAAGHSVTLVDLPVVAEWARAETSGVDILAADLLEPGALDSLAGADVALLAHLLHDLSDEDAAAAARVAASILKPGGAVVVVEFPGDESGLFGPVFDLMMQLETAGRARTAAELTAILEDAGFDTIRRVETRGPTFLAVGVKR